MNSEIDSVDMNKTDAKQSESSTRIVMIGTPSYDGKISAWHASAIVETCKIGIVNNINILPIYMSYDALVQRARNDIVKLAIDNNVDDLVFIDSDIDWSPLDFFKLLRYDADIVAAPTIKKNDIEQYGVKLTEQFNVEENGLVSVDGVATGFMRIRKEALKKIYDISEEYTEVGKREPSRMVFEVKVVAGQLYSEDILFCQKWKDLGGKVYIDPLINCGHVGEKRWIGNFYEWFKLTIRK